jgi:hypothetical protein
MAAWDISGPALLFCHRIGAIIVHINLQRKLDIGSGLLSSIQHVDKASLARSEAM